MATFNYTSLIKRRAEAQAQLSAIDSILPVAKEAHDLKVAEKRAQNRELKKDWVLVIRDGEWAHVAPADVQDTDACMKYNPSTRTVDHVNLPNIVPTLKWGGGKAYGYHTFLKGLGYKGVKDENGVITFRK